MRKISNYRISQSLLVLSTMALAWAGTSGCNGAGGAAPASSATPSDSNAAAQASAEGSASAGGNFDPEADFKSDGEQITVALKYVTFKKSDGTPILSPEAAKAGARRMNELYKQCNVRFVIQDYVQEDAEKQGLVYGLSSMDQLEPIRNKFEEKNRLVAIFTGPWDHGSMGSANAWTMMPGSAPYGAVLESRVAEDAEIVAHEIGHYLGLDHVSDQSNMMNPIIYKTSTAITKSQCDTVRETANGFWRDALR